MNRIVFALGAVLLVAGVGITLYSTTIQVPQTDCYSIGVVYSNGTGQPFIGYRCLTPDITNVYSSIPTTNQTTQAYVPDGLLLAVIALVTMVIGYVIPKNTDQSGKAPTDAS